MKITKRNRSETRSFTLPKIGKITVTFERDPGPEACVEFSRMMERYCSIVAPGYNTACIYDKIQNVVPE